MDNKIILPSISEVTLPYIKEITNCIGVPRSVLASDEEIEYAWSDLPRELKKIPGELRNELIARACIAISVGLFDGAINYMWNASIMNLKKKIKDFGFNVVGQILGKRFDEEQLNDLKDAELLSLSLKLNLISEEGFYFLNQCRDMRNKFSAAHPSLGFIDDRELITYMNRCSKYALSTVINPKGVDISEFMIALKENKFNKSQLDTWIERLNNTHDAQREILFGMLHAIYCDPSSNEQSRINAIDICVDFVGKFTPDILSNLLDRHYDYQAKGNTKRHSASQLFFQKIGLLSALNKIEIHGIVSGACKKIYSVHMGFDNFYNEPPFAERLYEISKQNEIPETAQNEYVNTVLTCYVGNQYGVSREAIPYYKKMIMDFSPREIEILFKANKSNTVVANRIGQNAQCKERFIEAVSLIDKESIPTSLSIIYKRLLKK